MGYRIQYTNVGGVMDIPKKSHRRLLKAALILVVMCLLICFCSPVRHGIAWVLFPGIGEDGILKLEDLAQQIHQGVPIGEAVAAFCREILSDVS